MLERLLATPDDATEEDHAWRNAAACLTEDPELFFPEGESERYRSQIAAALSVCASCEVVESCLSYALETEQRTGIWGGTTATARRDLEVVGGRVRAVGRGRTVAGAARTGATLAGATLAGPIAAALADEPDEDLRRVAG